jgi:hypothetical protein
MTTSTTRTERYRLEIRRAAEPFETHGFFESLALAQQAADADRVGSGGAAYRITRECEPVTTAPHYQALSTPHPYAPLTDEQVRNAVEMGLNANPATARLAIGVEVMDHRVFLSGHVHDTNDVRRVEQATAHVADIGELVDLLDVECS